MNKKRMKRDVITTVAVLVWALCCSVIFWTAMTQEVHCDEPITEEVEEVRIAKPVKTAVRIPETVPKVEKVSLGEFTVTAYCPCKKCCGYWATVRPVDENGEQIVYTASGTVAAQGRTIAVDPEVIPYGDKIWFNGPWGVQAFVAEDCGNGVKGNHIDIYFESHEEARVWAKQTREVWVYKQEE